MWSGCSGNLFHLVVLVPHKLHRLASRIVAWARDAGAFAEHANLQQVSIRPQGFSMAENFSLIVMMDVSLSRCHL